VHAACTQLRQHRLDHLDFLAPQVAAFACVRVQAEHGNARSKNAEIG
jgi:hypothetical protein